MTSLATMQASSSIFTNRYSEGIPGVRFYGGTEYIDKLETLCQQRALAAFGLDPEVWGVNVQPYSGSVSTFFLGFKCRDLFKCTALDRQVRTLSIVCRYGGTDELSSFTALTAILRPHDRLMGLRLSDGGHITHGHYVREVLATAQVSLIDTLSQTTPTRKLNVSSVYFESLPYTSLPDKGTVDYDGLAAQAKVFRPRLIICGASAYPRDWDYSTVRDIADSVGAWVMGDIAHLSGLVAAQELNDPFEYCDIVTTTTHKTLRGPRAGLIFFRKNHPKAPDLERRINEAVSPICQNGPHNHVSTVFENSHYGK